MLLRINFFKIILLVLLFLVNQEAKAQIAKGLYGGYQIATVPGGMNNLRAMVERENIRYESIDKKMNYYNMMHGISAGWIIRGKNPLFTYGGNKHPFMEINWNNLHNTYTAKGKNADSLDYTSRYKVRFNSLGFIFGFPINDTYVFKTGIQGSNFNIFYKGSTSDKFDETEYKVVTDPEGFPVPYFHFGLDFPVSSGIYAKTYLNLSIDIAKELGYLYNVNHLGFQLYVPLKNQQ